MVSDLPTSMHTFINRPATSRKNRGHNKHNKVCFSPMLCSIREHQCEDTHGIYPGETHGSATVLCLDELIKDDSIDPQPSVCPSGPSPDMWLNLEVSEYYAHKETIMWEHMAKYIEQGNIYISMLHDTKWFRGWGGLPEGCTLKPVTAAAYGCCVHIKEEDVEQIFIYLDGSSATHDSEPVMSWGFCCFRIDSDLNHDLFFSSGGIMCSDEG